MAEPRTIRVFIASPGDLAVERAAFKQVLDELNDGFAAALDVKFVPLGWEDTLAQVGRRPQDEINQDVDRCDVFILAMHRRWGTKDPDVPKPATSRTEEEYLRALDRRQRTQSPRIFVFFKDIDNQSLADPGPQLEQVLAFKLKLEKSRKVRYRNFADEAGFRSEVDRHLRNVAKPDEPQAQPAALVPIELPAERIQELEQALAEAEQRTKQLEAELQQRDSGEMQQPVPRAAVEQLANARAEQLALALAERASKAALDGRVEEARQDFAKATDGTTNLRVLYLAYDFYERTGELATAEELLERSLAISGRDAETADTAAALGNLGLIYRRRGELDRAEEMHLKALAIDKKLGNQEGIARHTGNLGLIYETRGDLDRAEEMYRKALAIDEKLGRQEGTAIRYGNLGLIYQNRGELDRAEEMLMKALAINEKLGRQEGMAKQYGNFGLVYQARGELDRAEEMLMKALAINEKLGRQEGMAKQYGNLGLVYQARGELDRAEEMLMKALAIQERLGLQEYMANQYANLGLVAQARRELARARELWTKARDLYAKIGMPHMVKKVQGWLDGLEQGGTQE